ncbi:MAG: hypothetical protein LC667_11855 [Thioalkalivibrio sp.]|nr:hypothetical protein [Thioalkalivibrio sp.]
MAQTIFAGAHCNLLAPSRPHLSLEDGGHLVVVPHRHVANRLALMEAEALEMWRVSCIGALALAEIVGVDWYNFQENGNWTVNEEAVRHLHLHIYGRSRDSARQPFGEALRFPERKELAAWASTNPPPGALEELRGAAGRASHDFDRLRQLAASFGSLAETDP